jgi:hypothetical protein
MLLPGSVHPNHLGSRAHLYPLHRRVLISHTLSHPRPSCPHPTRTAPFAPAHSMARPRAPRPSTIAPPFAGPLHHCHHVTAPARPRAAGLALLAQDLPLHSPRTQQGTTRLTLQASASVPAEHQASNDATCTCTYPRPLLCPPCSCPRRGTPYKGSKAQVPYAAPSIAFTHLAFPPGRPIAARRNTHAQPRLRSTAVAHLHFEWLLLHPARIPLRIWPQRRRCAAEPPPCVSPQPTRILTPLSPSPGRCTHLSKAPGFTPHALVTGPGQDCRRPLTCIAHCSARVGWHAYSRGSQVQLPKDCWSNKNTWARHSDQEGMYQLDTSSALAQQGQACR